MSLSINILYNNDKLHQNLLFILRMHPVAMLWKTSIVKHFSRNEI